MPHHFPGLPPCSTVFPKLFHHDTFVPTTSLYLHTCDLLQWDSTVPHHTYYYYYLHHHCRLVYYTTTPTSVHTAPAYHHGHFPTTFLPFLPFSCLFCPPVPHTSISLHCLLPGSPCLSVHSCARLSYSPVTFSHLHTCPPVLFYTHSYTTTPHTHAITYHTILTSILPTFFYYTPHIYTHLPPVPHSFWLQAFYHNFLNCATPHLPCPIQFLPTGYTVPGQGLFPFPIPTDLHNLHTELPQTDRDYNLEQTPPTGIPLLPLPFLCLRLLDSTYWPFCCNCLHTPPCMPTVLFADNTAHACTAHSCTHRAFSGLETHDTTLLYHRITRHVSHHHHFECRAFHLHSLFLYATRVRLVSTVHRTHLSHCTVYLYHYYYTTYLDACVYHRFLPALHCICCAYSAVFPSVLVSFAHTTTTCIMLYLHTQRRRTTTILPPTTSAHRAGSP